MKMRHITTLAFRSFLALILSGQFLFTIAVSPGMAAPDQEHHGRTQARPAIPDEKHPNRPSWAVPDRPAHDFRSEHQRHMFHGPSEKIRQKKTEQSGAASSSQQPGQIENNYAYSDRIFLSALLAREEYAEKTASALLRTSMKKNSKLLEWAGQCREHAGRRLALIRQALPELGGLDQNAYQCTEQRIAETELQNRTLMPTGRFLLFLLSYCADSMKAAIPALLESPHESIANMAREQLISQAQLVSAVRTWLNTHQLQQEL